MDKNDFLNVSENVANFGLKTTLNSFCLYVMYLLRSKSNKSNKTSLAHGPIKLRHSTYARMAISSIAFHINLQKREITN